MNCSHCVSPMPDGSLLCSVCGSQTTVNPPPDRFIGQLLLQQYIVRKRLGQGGFGAVYEGEQPSLKRKVAIKVLHQTLTQDENVVKRFFREGLAASALERHPAAVKIFNLGSTDDGILFIVMEYLEGETLEFYLRKHGTLSASECMALLAPIFSLLKEAHQKGIIHRDLKPDNIFLARTDDASVPFLPRLLDFGLAGILESDEHITATGAVSGTPPYMPPEQWRGLKHTDARSDVYAMALIIYRCISGEFPFIAESTPDWMMKHTNTPPRALSEVSSVPPRFSMAVMRALEKDPSKRFSSIEAFEASLRESLMDAPSIEPLHTPEVIPPVVAKTVALPASKPQRWVGVAAVLALALLVYLGSRIVFHTAVPPVSAAALSISASPPSSPASTLVPEAKIPEQEIIYEVDGFYFKLNKFTNDNTADLSSVFESYVVRELSTRAKKVEAKPGMKLFVIDGSIKNAEVKSQNNALTIKVALRIKNNGSVFALLEQSGQVDLPDLSLKSIQDKSAPVIEALSVEIVSSLISSAPKFR
jgi:serine/threonine protein kinase